MEILGATHRMKLLDFVRLLPEGDVTIKSPDPF
jgi:hypothetical protein